MSSFLSPYVKQFGYESPDEIEMADGADGNMDRRDRFYCFDRWCSWLWERWRNEMTDRRKHGQTGPILFLRPLVGVVKMTLQTFCTKAISRTSPFHIQRITFMFDFTTLTSANLRVFFRVPLLSGPLWTGKQKVVSLKANVTNHTEYQQTSVCSYHGKVP